MPRNAGLQRHHDKLWAGIEPATRDFIREMGAAGKLTAAQRTSAREWLRACVQAGLSTALDADLADPRFVALYDARITAASDGIERVRRRHTACVREGLRVYIVALEQGRRTSPVPMDALPAPHAWRLSVEEARGKLPSGDQAKLAAVDALFLKLATKQYGGDGERREMRSDGRKLKMTMAYRSQAHLRAVMDDFIRQGALREWEPFSLEGLLTPDRVIEFLYYSERLDGGYYDVTTILRSERLLLDYIYRARTSGRTPIHIVSPEREAALREAVRLEKDNRSKWNKRAARDNNRGTQKWLPTLDQVSEAIAALEQRIARLDDRLARRRIGRNAYWRKLRDAVLTLCALYGMWRVDTASTLSLLHFKHYRDTNDKVDKHGFAVICNSARAKSSGGSWYPFVEELTLPPAAVTLIKKLLAFEGRSLAQPLRVGEEPVYLSAERGDRWGDDPVLVGELVVVPIFRRCLNDPAGLTYAGVKYALERVLRTLSYGATNPHVLRAAGAIYWSFIVGLPEALVMQLGLWEDAATLRSCYARIQGDDQRRLMFSYLPTPTGGVPPRVHGRREQAAAAALTTLGKLLEKPSGALEARRLLAELRRHYETIDQTIAAEMGKRWEPMRADPLLPGERESVDEELRARGCKGGIEEVIGRRLFAESVLRDLAAEAAAERGVPPAIRSRWQLVQPALPALTDSRMPPSHEAA